MTAEQSPTHVIPGNGEVDAEYLRRLARRTWVQRLSDWAFGYDFFISYRWTDGRRYAASLVKALERKGYDCFLDTKDYSPGENWVAGGQRALRKTTRLILLCTRDAVKDPQGRRGDADPIFRELSAFSRGDRRKVRIEIHAIPESDWAESEVSAFFGKYDLFLSDAPDGPSERVLEDLDRGCHREKIDRRRLRLIGVACGVLLALALSLSWALVFADAQRREAGVQRNEALKKGQEALEQRNSAMHNLGVSKIKEAGRLATESRKWEAIGVLAQTLGLSTSPPVDLSFPDGSLLRPESAEALDARVTMYQWMNDALVPVSEDALPDRSATFTWLNNAPVALSLSGKEFSLYSLSQGGQKTTYSLPTRATHLVTSPLETGALLWVDDVGDLHRFEPTARRDTRLDNLSPDPGKLLRLWATPAGSSMAYLLRSEAPKPARLWWRDMTTKSARMLDGQWDEKSLAVFLDEQHLLVCGQRPFPERNDASNVWFVALYRQGQTRPSAMVELDAELVLGEVGAFYPDATCLTRLHLDSKNRIGAAIGCSDGTVRLVTSEKEAPRANPESAKISLLQTATLKQPPSFRGKITSVASAHDDSVVVAGTQDGAVLTWDIETRQPLNASPGHRAAVQSVLGKDEIYFSSDANGSVKQWRDRFYLQALHEKAEIVGMVNLGDDEVEVLTFDDKVRRYALKPEGLVRGRSKSVNPSEWRAESFKIDPAHERMLEKARSFFSESVAEVTVTHDGKHAVVCFDSSWAELWKLDDTGQFVEAIWRNEILGDGGRAVSVAISPDDTRVALSGFAYSSDTRWIGLFSIPDGRELFRYHGLGNAEFGSMNYVFFVKGGRELVTGLYGTVYRWPTEVPPWFFRDPTRHASP